MHVVIVTLLWLPYLAAYDFCPAGNDKCRRSTLWTVDHSLDDQVLSGPAVQLHPGALEPGQCSLLCQGQKGCNFFFYNKDSKQCLTCPAPCHDVTLSQHTGFRFYRRDTDKLCLHPPVVYRATASRQFAVPGHDVLYHCTPPAVLVSSPYSTGRRQCSSGGTWTTVAGDPDPVCKASCGSTPSFGGLVADRSAGYEGDAVTYSCSSGWLHSSGRHVCSADGSWTLTDSNGPLCLNGLRLVNGADGLEGRVEAMVNGVWGSMCDDVLEDSSAAVICKMLGYTSGVARPNAYFGQGSDPILLDDVTCSDGDSNIIGCSTFVTGTPSCGHSMDIGVRCQN